MMVWEPIKKGVVLAALCNKNWAECGQNGQEGGGGGGWGLEQWAGTLQEVPRWCDVEEMQLM